MTELEPTEMIGRIITAQFSEIGSPERRIAGVGKVISYTDAPTFEIEHPDGSRFSWRADLCRKPTTEELERTLLGITRGREKR